MIDIEVQNFQSIQHVKFRITGFTALVGRSNIGKSAIVRAVKTALTGAAGTDFVRHGPTCERRERGRKKCRCQATVRIKTSKIDMVWEKGDAINRYTVTAEGETTVYDKADRGTPPFLQPDFNQIKIGDSQDLIQMSEQFSPVFLLNQSGPAVADVLSDVARLDDINEAMRLSEKDRKEAASTRKVREKDIVELETSLGKYEGLDAVAKRAGAIQSRYKAIADKQEALEQLTDFLASLRQLATSIRALGAATRPGLPDYDKLESLATRYEELEDFLAAVSNKAPIIRRLTGIDKVELPVFEAVRTKQAECLRLAGWLERLRVFKTSLAKWKKLSGVSDLEAKREAALVTKVLQAAQVGKLMDRQAKLEKEEAALEAALDAAATEEQTALGEINELGICPTCSQTISGDHLHLESA